MTKSTKTNKIIRSNEDIQSDSNLLLANIVSEINNHLPDVRWRYRNEEDQQDKGIDIQYELEDRNSSETIHLFKIQNKGTDEKLNPLKTSKNKGYISFPLSIRHANYYRREIPVALIFTVCDLSTKKIYWHAVQLDSSIDTRVSEAIKNKKDSIRIYIDPLNQLSSNTVENFFKDVHSSYQEQVKRFNDNLSNNPLFLRKLDFRIEIDRAKPILEQLYEFTKSQYQELNYVPIHLLIQQYPFKAKDNYYPYYSQYTLYTDNQEMIDLIDSLDIREDGSIGFNKVEFIKNVKEYEQKTKEILIRLSRNLIFFLRTDNSQLPVHIYYNHPTRCECIRCKYARFELKETFENISNIPAALDEQLKLAYLNYEIGNFASSSKMFLDLLGKCNDKPIIKYIIYHNLSKLAVFTRNHYWGEYEEKELTSKLKNIDLKEELTKCTNDSNKAILEHINSNSFFYDSLQQIQSTVKKIKDHYFSQLRGGWASNQEVDKLISEFAQLVSFLDRNYIIYDAFSEFYDLVDTFLEGVMASHAIDEKGGSRLAKFNDFVIINIIHYCKADSIIKYFNRYKLKELAFEPTNTNGHDLMSIIVKFFDESEEAWTAFKNNCEPGNRYFNEKYDRYFRNLLLVAGLIDLNKKQVNIISEKLIKFLKEETYIPRYDYKYLKIFIHQKGKLINNSNLKELLKVCLENGKAHDREHGVFETIATQFKDFHGGLVIGNKEFEKLLAVGFKECPICKTQHLPLFMVNFYQAIKNGKQKEAIRNGLIEFLNNRFEEEVFYWASIHDVIGINKFDYLEKLIATAKPKENQISFKSIFGDEKNEDKRYNSLNMLINLCFKYGVNLKEGRFKAFIGINDYYDWLTGMGSFDYTKFNPKWISEYGTKYYFAEMRKYPIIKQKVYTYLKENRNEMLERDLIIHLTEDE